MNGNKLQEDEWEKWRREVDRPSAGLVFGGLLMVPLVWLWWGRWYVGAVLGIGLMLKTIDWLRDLVWLRFTLGYFCFISLKA